MKRLIGQFAIGMSWLSIWATLVSMATQSPFWIVLPAMFALALGGGAMALFWIARWAERDAPRGQFGIATLLLIMIYVAAFLSCVRWALVATRQAHAELFPPHDGSVSLEPGLYEFAMSSLASFALLVVSLPCLPGLLDSVMWFAVGLLKMSWIKAAVARLRRPGDQNYSTDKSSSDSDR